MEISTLSSSESRLLLAVMFCRGGEKDELMSVAGITEKTYYLARTRLAELGLVRKRAGGGIDCVQATGFTVDGDSPRVGNVDGLIAVNGYTEPDHGSCSKDDDGFITVNGSTVDINGPLLSNVTVDDSETSLRSVSKDKMILRLSLETESKIEALNSKFEHLYSKIEHLFDRLEQMFKVIETVNFGTKTVNLSTDSNFAPPTVNFGTVNSGTQLPKITVDSKTEDPDSKTETTRQQKVGAILRLWHQTFPQVTLPPSVAQQMLNQASGDLDRVLDTITRVGGRTDIEKPVGYVLAALRNPPAGESLSTVNEEVVTEEEKERRRKRNELAKVAYERWLQKIRSDPGADRYSVWVTPEEMDLLAD